MFLFIYYDHVHRIAKNIPRSGVPKFFHLNCTRVYIYILVYWKCTIHVNVKLNEEYSNMVDDSRKSSIRK